MDPTRFDIIAKLFATRRTRRGAIAGGIGLAATGFGTHALAQESTPAATPFPNAPHPSADDNGQKTEFLFVQPFDGGTWVPKDGEDGVYTLTLTGAAAQTVYFSDRPERIVGLTPMQAFLDGLGFTPNNPPNAAIVAQREGGDGQEVLVVELLDPRYDADAETLTYDARTLADYGEPGLAHLARKQQDYELPESFGAGSLFIDDCPTVWGTCSQISSGEPVGNITDIGQCWTTPDNSPYIGACMPCDLPLSSAHYGSLCNQGYPDECEVTECSNGDGLCSWDCEVTDLFKPKDG